MEKRKEFTEKHKKLVAGCALAVFAAVVVFLTVVVGKPMVQYFSEPEQFRAWVDAHGIWGRVAFVLLVILQVLVALIPGEPLEIGAGYAFGAFEGTILSVLGITLGSLLIFWFVRRFGIKFVEVFFPREKINSVKFLKDAKKLELITFLVFFLPGTPKDLLSYFVGLTNIKLSKWLLIASIARLPSVITSTVGGNALGKENYRFAIIVFAVTFVLSALGWLIYHHIQKKHEEKKEKDL